MDMSTLSNTLSFLLLYAGQSETDSVEHYETTNHHNGYPSVSGLGTRTLSFQRYERHPRTVPQAWWVVLSKACCAKSAITGTQYPTTIDGTLVNAQGGPNASIYRN